MKNFITLIISLAILISGVKAQENCGSIVELQGTGMQSDGSALLSKTLSFTDISSIDSIADLKDLPLPAAPAMPIFIISRIFFPICQEVMN